MQDDIMMLSDDELAQLGLTTAEIVDSIEGVLWRNAAGQLWTAPKSALEPGDGRYMMTTLSVADDPGVMVVKAVLLNPENPGQGHEMINGGIMILDSSTGLLKSVMGANWITGVRTAGLSAVAARQLADPLSSTIAFVGCGVQARSHLDAFCDLFPLTNLHAYGRGQPNIDRLCELARDRGLTARACASPKEALEGADIIVTSITATFQGAPFLDAAWLKPGAFAAITDQARPWKPDSLHGFGSILIDDHEQENTAARRMVHADLVTADLSEAVSGNKRVAFDPSKRSAFIFRGMASGDFAVAALAYRRARELA